MAARKELHRGLNPDETIAREGALGRTPSGDLGDLGMMVNDLAPWLAAEYAAAHGAKASRPAYP